MIGTSIEPEKVQGRKCKVKIVVSQFNSSLSNYLQYGIEILWLIKDSRKTDCLFAVKMLLLAITIISIHLVRCQITRAAHFLSFFLQSRQHTNLISSNTIFNLMKM